MVVVWWCAGGGSGGGSSSCGIAPIRWTKLRHNNNSEIYVKSEVVGSLRNLAPSDTKPN
jgi:hypothetical protein